MKIITFLCIFLGGFTFGFSQSEIKYKVHSHNDYLKAIPFWDAYSAGASSIEVDLFFKDSTLYATHSEADIIEGRTFESLYLEPLQKAYSLGLGENQELILLIDIKSEAYHSLDAVVKAIEKYDFLTKNKKIKFVISGNRPKVSDYPTYPDFIYFDYQSLESDLTPEQMDKIALVSLNFQKYVKWNGQQEMTPEEYAETEKVVKQAHSLNKEFRFWGIPDTEISWTVFSKLGVDYINTDNTYKCVSFLRLPTPN
jgi:alkaline phosphatase